MTDLRQLVAQGVLDAELAGLVWALAEHGVPLVVASREAAESALIRRAFTAQVLASQPGRDAVAGGTVLAASLEDVLGLLGGREVTDDARDIGVVLVVRDGRVAVAHYVRPLERDAAGHIQRRPPALVSSWNDAFGRLDHFHWAFTGELATRAGMTRHELEDEAAGHARWLAGFNDEGAGARGH